MIHVSIILSLTDKTYSLQNEVATCISICAGADVAGRCALAVISSITDVNTRALFYTATLLTFVFRIGALSPVSIILSSTWRSWHIIDGCHLAVTLLDVHYHLLFEIINTLYVVGIFQTAISTFALSQFKSNSHQIKFLHSSANSLRAKYYVQIKEFNVQQ